MMLYKFSFFLRSGLQYLKIFIALICTLIQSTFSILLQLQFTSQDINLTTSLEGILIESQGPEDQERVKTYRVD